jgi:hypothetical protein
MLSKNEEMYIKAISKINDKLDNAQEDCNYPYRLEFITDGFYSFIKFLGWYIWSSEDNEMSEEQQENPDQYHAMLEFLTEAIEKQQKQVASLKL